jgi:hypothetical protein
MRSMSSSNRPSVLGFVSIRPATSSSTSFSRAPTSTSPRPSLGTCTASYPASRTLAGFVPWAESGMQTFRRSPPDREPWYARITKRPVSSPHAPAGGCNVARAIPVISQSARSRRQSSSSEPWTVDAGWSGCARWNPGSCATFSAIFGLYFIEHDPSG